MQEIEPYQTLEELEKDLDNGGRFYNLFTKASDKVVTSAELVKAAGVFGNEAAGIVGHEYVAFLFLEMAQHELLDKDRTSVDDIFESKLLSRYKKQKPQTLKPSTVEAKGTDGTSLIITGYPKLVEDKTSYQGLKMIPSGGSGGMMQFIWIPIFDQFDVYAIFDDPSNTQPSSIIATQPSTKFEEDRPYRFGGILRQAKFEDETKDSHEFYLEVFYYTPL